MGGGSSVKERSRAQLAPTKDVMFGWVAVVLWKKDREHSSLLQKSSLIYRIASAARSYKGCDVWMGGGSSVKERSRAQLAPTKDVMFGWVAVVLWKKDREHSSLLQKSSLIYRIASAARSYKGCDVWMGGGSSVKERSRAARSYRGGVGKDVMFGWVAVVL